MRFEAVLGDAERAEFSTRVSSYEGIVSSWVAHTTGWTYARIEYSATTPGQGLRAAYPAARVDEPALVVLEIAADDPRAVVPLAAALGGAAGPAGVISVRHDGALVALELDAERTALALVVHLIDGELALGVPGRRIRPLTGISDRVLARFAGSILATPELDETRLIEHYSEPLLRAEPV